MATRAKKAKTKSRYRNKLKTEWSAEFPGIVSSKGNTEKARCVYCGTDFGIGHGGRSDVKRHVETEGHRNAVVDTKQTGRQVRLSEMRYPPRVRTSAFIHYVILLNKYIELPILYKYFGIFHCESEIKYSENV